MNTLIANAGSPRNIGDRAMLKVLISLLGVERNLKIHSADLHKISDKLEYDPLPTLYAWAVFQNINSAIRLKRLIELYVNYVLLSLSRQHCLIGESRGIIEDYMNSEEIIFVGGGYLRSQGGITQSLNLMMNLMMFQFAKKSNAKKIIAPISFGPFAYEWQEKYSAHILKDFDLVAVREKYSYELLKKYDVKNLVRSSDLALLLDVKKNANKNKLNKFVLGFTIRKWLPRFQQEKFEKGFVDGIIKFSKEFKLVVQPIVQADAPEFGDIDSDLTEKIVQKVKKCGVSVKPIFKIKDFDKDIKVYGEIDLLLGMRMHSNILAAIQGTPFVAISYEHKTEGITLDLGIEGYSIKVEDVNENDLYELLVKAYKNRKELEKTINNSIANIRKQEIKRWSRIESII